MFYRFNCGSFQEADTFEEAQEKFIKRIQDEVENPEEWTKCPCLGLSHHWDCPQHLRNLPYDPDDDHIPF